MTASTEMPVTVCIPVWTVAKLSPSESEQKQLKDPCILAFDDKTRC